MRGATAVERPKIAIDLPPIDLPAVGGGELQLGLADAGGLALLRSVNQSIKLESYSRRQGERPLPFAPLSR